MDDPAGELEGCRARPTRPEQVDVVRERYEKPLAARIATSLDSQPPPEPSCNLRHPGSRRPLGRLRTSVSVEAGVALDGQRQEPEHLVELLRLGRGVFVEREPERVEQRVERVAPLGLH
jgi:hypothetical protein